jgi:hypothetical protein
MKSTLFSVSSLAGLGGLALALNSAGQAKPVEPAAKPPAAIAAGASSAQLPAEDAIPKSVFQTPPNPAQGWNPFFPNSAAFSPSPVPPPTNAPDAVLVLNGINGATKRLAMINGRTFEAGEEGEVRLPSGSKILVKCVEVRDRSVIIQVGGQRRELKLRDD